MNCDMQCMANKERTFVQTGLISFLDCKCGNGVVKITPQKVNTFSIIKDTYGDLNSLSQEDIETID
jgi:hypothetical protein